MSRVAVNTIAHLICVLPPFTDIYWHSDNEYGWTESDLYVPSNPAAEKKMYRLLLLCVRVPLSEKAAVM